MLNGDAQVGEPVDQVLVGRVAPRANTWPPRWWMAPAPSNKEADPQRSSAAYRVFDWTRRGLARGTGTRVVRSSNPGAPLPRPSGCSAGSLANSSSTRLTPTSFAKTWKPMSCLTYSTASRTTAGSSL